MVSCGTWVREGWRTELHLGRGEPFDDSHGSTAERTRPEGEDRGCGEIPGPPHRCLRIQSRSGSPTSAYGSSTPLDPCPQAVSSDSPESTSFKLQCPAMAPRSILVFSSLFRSDRTPFSITKVFCINRLITKLRVAVGYRLRMVCNWLT